MSQNKNITNFNPNLYKWFQGHRVNKTIIKVIIPISISLGGLGYLETKTLAAPSILSNNNVNIHSDNSNNNLKNNNNVEKISKFTQYSNKTLPVTKDTDDHTTIISSTNQSGGITAQTVNVTQQSQQLRHLNQFVEQDLVSKIPKNSNVKVTAVLGDQEAFAFATEVSQFLKNDQYNIEGPDQAVFNKPVVGQFIKQTPPNNYDIIIGSNQHQ